MFFLWLIGIILAYLIIPSLAKILSSMVQLTMPQALLQSLSFAKRYSDIETERSIIFLTVTLEESGLLGSEYFAKYPPIDLSQVVGGFNFDCHPAKGTNQ